MQVDDGQLLTTFLIVFHHWVATDVVMAILSKELLSSSQNQLGIESVLHISIKIDTTHFRGVEKCPETNETRTLIFHPIGSRVTVDVQMSLNDSALFAYCEGFNGT